MQYLQTMRIASFYDQVRDPKIAVFQLLGFAFRSLPGSEAHALMCSMLRWSYIGHHVEARTDSTNTMAPLTTEYLQLRSPLSNLSTELNAPSDSHNEDNLPRYTSALFERGQEDGRVIQRTYSTLTLDPPRFKVSIKFGRWNGSGTGRNKKIAGHLAAKDLCDRLGITI